MKKLGDSIAVAHISFSNEKDTKGAGAAVAGYGAAGFVPIDVFKVGEFLNCIGNSLKTFICHRSAGDEKGFSHQIIPVCKTVLHVCGKTLGIVSSILFYNAHFAVFNFNAGLEV